MSGRVEGHTDRLENGETRKGCVLLNLILAEITRVTEFVNWGADLGSLPQGEAIKPSHNPAYLYPGNNISNDTWVTPHLAQSSSD